MERKKIIITSLRDLMNFLFFFGILYSITYYSYNLSPELVPLKNIIFPMEVAVLLCLLATVILIFINRITTFIAIRLMKNK